MLENMHVLKESAASLYKTHWNVTLTLILVRCINDIYVFGLQMSLWRRFWIRYCEKLCVQNILLLFIQCTLYWMCLEDLLRYLHTNWTSFDRQKHRNWSKLPSKFWYSPSYIERSKANIYLITESNFLSILWQRVNFLFKLL